jgi:hypothetical protein
MAFSARVDERIPMQQNLFISYAHRDMTPIHWLDRLKVYLAPLRTSYVDIWDDSRIAPGANWRRSIETALAKADAAILLVGPNFFASQFITDVELPSLLSAAESGGRKVFPLVVGYCMYSTSVLGPFQSFNDPNNPMEALVLADQNKSLNALCIAVDEALRHRKQSMPGPGADASSSADAVKMMQRRLSDTHKAFVAQCQRRDDLVAAITHRLGFQNDLEYEKFFIRFYTQLTTEERFEFDQIRALTEGPLVQGNKAILQILESHPELLDELPILVDLQQHLVFWLNKYDRVFVKTPGMCLLYTGVEDGVPFPATLDKAIASWLQKSKAKATSR